jgi:serine/threonine-protein kinase RsbW
MLKYEFHENIVLPSRQSSLDLAESLIEHVRDKYVISLDRYYNILIAITEAVNNAISHGNHYDQDKHVKFDVYASPQGIEIFVQDEGKGFDPNKIEDCTKEENLLKDSGRGIFIMQSLADEFEISSNVTGTLFRMYFGI